MVETITIRPEPLIPAGGANAPAAMGRASAALEASEPAIAFEDMAKQEYFGMIKTGGAAGEANFAGTGQTGARVSKSGDSDFGFFDLLDIINPLQHIPIVSTLYRELTGDTIKPAMKLAGGALLGGLGGLVSGVVDAVVETQTGKDIGQNMLALFDDGSVADTQVASAAPEKKPELKPAGITLSAVPQSPIIPGISPQQIAAASVPMVPAISKQDKDVMSLFGNSNPSAHASYQKANMLGYLTDVSRSNAL